MGTSPVKRVAETSAMVAVKAEVARAVVVKAAARAAAVRVGEKEGGTVVARA